MYTFCDRLKLGLQQLMAGARKFAIQYIDRSDLVSLTKEATEVTGIPYVMESDMEEADRILLWSLKMLKNPERKFDKGDTVIHVPAFKHKMEELLFV